MSPNAVKNNGELGDPNPSNFQGGFINKKYIFKYTKITKIGALLKLFFWLYLLPRFPNKYPAVLFA